MLRILFMGTPDFAKESLEDLYEYGYEICGVVTTPDRPSGRGMKLIGSPVKQYALEKNLKLFQPEKITNNKEFKETIKEMNPDIVCVVSYGMILPKSFLKIPKMGCVNVHPSLLPKYRGSAPIQWAILNGDKITGVTTMYMDEKMDTGDIILKQEVEVGEDETTGELWNRLSTIGSKLLIETLEKIEKEIAPREKQGENFVIAPMLSREMSKIDWENKSSSEIKNLVRGLNPIMGAYSFINNKKFKFWKVKILTDNAQIETDISSSGMPVLKLNEIEPGIVLLADEKTGLYIKTKDAIISVLEIQGENSKRMSINDFLRGNKINVLDKFI